MDDEILQVAGRIAANANQHRETWTPLDPDYWFQRLVQEVGELGSSLAGDHKDPPEHELYQIAGIALNWLVHMGEGRS